MLVPPWGSRQSVPNSPVLSLFHSFFTVLSICFSSANSKRQLHSQTYPATPEPGPLGRWHVSWFPHLSLSLHPWGARIHHCVNNLLNFTLGPSKPCRTFFSHVRTKRYKLCLWVFHIFDKNLTYYGFWIFCNFNGDRIQTLPPPHSSLSLCHYVVLLGSGHIFISLLLTRYLPACSSFINKHFFLILAVKTFYTRKWKKH